MTERDKNGRFAKGNGGGPGRPRKQREIRYYEVTQESCTFADWKEIVKKAVQDAKTGDTAARRWLSDYLMGAPQQYLDLTSLGDAVGLVDNEQTLAEAIAIVKDHTSG